MASSLLNPCSESVSCELQVERKRGAEEVREMKPVRVNCTLAPPFSFDLALSFLDALHQAILGSSPGTVANV